MVSLHIRFKLELLLDTARQRIKSCELLRRFKEVLRTETCTMELK